MHGRATAVALCLTEFVPMSHGQLKNESTERPDR
jgi:hypothetical protein